MSALLSFALGIGTKNKKGAWLEVYYPKPLLQPADAVLAAAKSTLNYTGGNSAIELNKTQLSALQSAFEKAGLTEQAQLANTLQSATAPVMAMIIEKDEAPTSTAEVYLKLQLLSHRLVVPHQLNLTGIFPLLPNVAWTNDGAIDLEELPERQLQARLQGKIIEVMSVDKFPKMTNYIVPKGTRIADTDRVRLGAYVGEGTTVMHEGFINFNAGTKGVSMVEGRISAGVVVGEHSDLGGGCSTMGTLSGGGTTVISVGEKCLLGANAGLGIPLGDRCTLESGLYITAGVKVTVLDDKGQEVAVVKARELSGKPDLTFRRNSINGRIEVVTNKTAIELNNALHAHN
jgi:2,3,4,5-tetrahydropyridine-2-carboxylate N-succinyltransferase